MTHDEWEEEALKQNVADESRDKEPRSIVTPMFEGRPERYLPINHEDIINLEISLNTTKDVLAFIESI
jgi:hypothetical protein